MGLRLFPRVYPLELTIQKCPIIKSQKMVVNDFVDYIYCLELICFIAKYHFSIKNALKIIIL